MTKLYELQLKTEEIGNKNEYSKAVMESIKEDLLDLVDLSNKKEVSKEITFYELQRVAKRTEIIFNLLGELMSESDDLNTKITSELVIMQSKEI